MTFWAIAIGLLVVLLVWFGLVIRRAGDGALAASGDIQVYRDQLAEVEREVARGLTDAPAGEQARTEIARRILAADRQGAGVPVAMPRHAFWGGMILIVAAFGGGLWLYSVLGAPGFGDLTLKTRIEATDMARADRPTQGEAEAVQALGAEASSDERLIGLVDELRRVLETRPDDVEGLGHLMRYEAALGNFGASRKAQERLVAAKGEEVVTNDIVVLADLMVYAAGGLVTAEAEPVLGKILDRDPQNGTARYYVGLMHAQTGREDLAFAFWRPLLEEGPADAPWMVPIRASIADLARVAGVRYSPPEVQRVQIPALREILAIEGLEKAEREAMIRALADALSNRLASEGGGAEDWADLIKALGLLGENERAGAIWQEAQRVFGENPDQLATIRRAAVAAEVEE